jgi:hypothetical protein
MKSVLAAGVMRPKSGRSTDLTAFQHRLAQGSPSDGVAALVRHREHDHDPSGPDYFM